MPPPTLPCPTSMAGQTHLPPPPPPQSHRRSLSTCYMQNLSKQQTQPFSWPPGLLSKEQDRWGRQSSASYFWGLRCWGLSSTVIKVTQRHHLCKVREEPQMGFLSPAPPPPRDFQRPPGLILGWGNGASPDQLPRCCHSASTASRCWSNPGGWTEQRLRNLLEGPVGSPGSKCSAYLEPWPQVLGL